ncbi:hypothetical protein BEN47_17470 [Hymenobacter lapidarius]|uniref:Uncharacterized protein n=1 Tax=Hymenobacter lapidarius TaxID=1908237 RepID=A0A1G1SY43_9BACT|nr:hypothetical protein [Hymenobacter lapidarius]OGX83524.1 hypothetical protein BEN47_17470 [Hymenobacter lapidarius]
MSYSESQVYLQHADQSLADGHYQRAAGRYAELVVGLQPKANATRPLTPDAVPLVRQYVAACQGWAAALRNLKQGSPAETVLLAVLGKLRRFIGNLSTPTRYRAQLLTDYKTCFYALADFYLGQEQPERLAAYVQQHADELHSWQRNLGMQTQAQHPN